jgi:hypothetical protein
MEENSATFSTTEYPYAEDLLMKWKSITDALI